MQTPRQRTPSPAVVAAAGWLCPGLGYFLIGQRARAYIGGTAVIIAYLLGILIGGIRVVDVPGYDLHNERRTSKIELTYGQWLLRIEPFAQIGDKPWYIAQSLNGPINVIATAASLQTTAHPSVARMFDIGTLYTSVAGMLNLLMIIDAAYRSTRPAVDPARQKPNPASTTVTALPDAGGNAS